VGIKVSPTLQRKIDSINELTEDAVERKMLRIAEDIVRLSPVDTGAFVNSWSFKDNLGGGRSKSSEGKPRGRNKESERGKSLNNLVNDILKTVDSGSTRGSVRSGLEVSAANYYFLNRAPHAISVDLKHGIQAQIRNLHG